MFRNFPQRISAQYIENCCSMQPCAQLSRNYRVAETKAQGSLLFAALLYVQRYTHVNIRYLVPFNFFLIFVIGAAFIALYLNS
jgi:hypothetical protein